MELRLPVFYLAALLSSAAGAKGQTTWHVDVTGFAPGNGTSTAPYTSIQYALSQPSTLSGDVILVQPGAYVETIDFLGKGVSVRSTNGAAVTAIDGQHAGTVVTITGPVFPPAELEGFTIRSGAGSSWSGTTAGGGIFLENTHAYVRACVIERNSAALGAGVLSASSTITLSSCTIRGNIAESAPGLQDGHGGGFYTTASTDIVQGCRIERNLAGRGAGVFAAGSNLALKGGKIVENHVQSATYVSYGEGGGLYAAGGGILYVGGVEISRNSARGDIDECRGAGLYLSGLDQALLQNCAINDNFASDFSAGGDGGGIFASGLQLRVEDTTLDGNTALFHGGGVYGDGEYVRCTISNSFAQFGGGVYANSMLLRRCKISGNFAGNWDGGDEGQGGGAYGGRLEECELTGNEATDGGAAVYATLIDCDVAHNWVAPFYLDRVFGGGVYECTLVRCRLFDNVAFGGSFGFTDYFGLGAGAARSTLTDCEVFDNRVVARGFGAGVFESVLTGCRLYGNSALGGSAEPIQGGGADGSSLSFCAVFENAADEGGGASNSDLDRCTVWGNQAAIRGDGLFYTSARTVSNSIIWNNGDEEILDLSGGLTVEYCDVKGGWSEANNIALDPGLWDPAVGDFHLLPSSPCIDAGNPLALPDPDGSRADIGAHHFDPTYCGEPSTYCTAKLNSQGCSPRIDSAGTPSFTGADDFFVVASEVLANKPAFLLWSLDGTPLHSSLLGGWLCTGVPLQRTGAQVSGGASSACSGTLSFHFSQAFMGGGGLGYGTTVYAQYVSRDTVVPSGFGLTNGLRFVICP